MSDFDSGDWDDAPDFDDRVAAIEDRIEQERIERDDERAVIDRVNEEA